MARVVRRLGFGFLAALALAARPAPAMACSGPVTTYADALARAHVIVVAQVSARHFDGAAYDLTIEKVYRGVVASPFRVGATSDPGVPPMCSLSFDVGERVVLALEDAEDLGAFTSAGWVILADGTLRTEGSISGAPTSAAKLLADLDRLPDTALRTTGVSSGEVVGVAGFVGMFLLLALLLRRARPTRT